MSSDDKTVAWGVVGGSGFAATGAVPAVLSAQASRLAAVLSRDSKPAGRALDWACGWDLARKTGGPRVAEKLRYSRVGKTLDALRNLGRLTPSRRSAVVYTDEGAFMAAPHIEAVWVASPPFLHARHATAALGQGKHVLCEKPLAASTADVRAMIDAARSANRLLGVGYHMRQHPAHRALRDSCLAGELGRIESFEAVMHFRHPDPRPWHASKAESGGWAVNEAGTHLVDLALWFLGRDGTNGAVSVEADLSSGGRGFETDDRAVVSVTFNDGAVARLDVATAAEAPAAWFEVVGSEGKARLTGTMFGSGGTLECRENGRDGGARPIAPVDLYRLQVEQFGRALRGDASAVVVTAEEGLKNLEIVERARGW